jgi:bacterioferritin
VVIVDKKVVKELNAYLKGEYMAIKAYDEFLDKIKDPGIMGELQNIQGDHKKHAAMVSNRIISLGGKPVKGPGWMGTMANMKKLVKKNSDAANDILKDAGVGEYRGIRMAEEVVKGDLDEESLGLIKNILDEDRGHVGKLEGFIH